MPTYYDPLDDTDIVHIDHVVSVTYCLRCGAKCYNGEPKPCLGEDLSECDYKQETFNDNPLEELDFNKD